MNFPVFDLHCDTALSLIDDKLNPERKLRRNCGHIDLERGDKLTGYAQCFAIFTTPAFSQWYHCSPEEVFSKAFHNFRNELNANRDLILQAFSGADIQENFSKKKMSAIFTLEGPAGISFNPEKLEDLYQKGLRISTLGWNEQNPLTGSHLTGGGLTDLGREYVMECQRLGILVDVSHISDEGFWDIMKITGAPIVASHSNSRSVCYVSRNLTDDMFRAICETDGTVGINLYSSFLSESHADLNAIRQHIFHFLEIDPQGEHISLGGDLDGCESLPEDFTGVDSYNILGDYLLSSGLDEKLLLNIYWNNAIGVMDRAVHIYQK